MPSTAPHSKPKPRKKGVKDLCESLGFGNGTEWPQSMLTETTHRWRKDYISGDGKSKLGKDLRDKHTEEGKHDLRLMTQAYLKHGGFGLTHWPPPPHDSSKASLEYPRDKQRITELLQQLFCKHNEHEHEKVQRASRRNVTSTSKMNTSMRGHQDSAPQDSESSYQPSEAPPSPSIQSPSCVKQTKKNGRPLTGKSRLPGGDGGMSPTGLSDDGLLDLHALIDHPSNTPKRPPRAVDVDQPCEYYSNEREAKGDKTKTSLVVTLKHVQTTKENEDRSRRGIAPVARMTALPAEPEATSNRAQRSHIAIPGKTPSHHESQEPKENYLDSLYDLTPPNKSLSRRGLQESKEANHILVYNVHDPFTLRSSTRTRDTSVSEKNHNHDDNGGHSVVENPVRRSAAPDAQDTKLPDAEAIPATPRRILRRRTNVSGLQMWDHDDEPGVDDSPCTPTRISYKKRTASQILTDSIDQRKAPRQRRRTKSPHREQSPIEQVESPIPTLPTRLGHKSRITEPPHDHVNPSQIEHGDKEAIPERYEHLQQQWRETSSSRTVGSSVSPASPIARHPLVAQKRVHLTSACNECRRKKIKCNGKELCSHCSNRDDCTYDSLSNPRLWPHGSPDQNVRPADRGAPALGWSDSATPRQSYRTSPEMNFAFSFLRPEDLAPREEQQFPSPKPSNSSFLEHAKIEDIQMERPLPNLMMTTSVQTIGHSSPRPSSNSALEYTETGSIQTEQPLRETDTSTSMQPKQEPSPTNPKPQYRVSYFVISRVPRRSRKKWPNRSLQNKTLKFLFDEISAFAGRRDVREILFVLNASEESTCPLTRDDTEDFEEMKRDFSKAISRDRKNGITQFRIELVLNPGEEQAEKVEEESDDDIMLL